MSTTVFPFILRNVNLSGIDSVVLPIAEQARVWQRLATDWKLSNLESLVAPLQLADLSAAIDRILAGKMVARGVLCLA